MKKRYIIISSLALMFAMITPVHGQDNQLGISFDGDSQQFVVFEGNPEDSALNDMLPGEQRIQTFTVKNEDYQTMRFYVRVDNTKLLETNDSSNRIVYDLDFKNNEESFFTGRIGGKTDAGKENLSENYLLKTLKKGESTTIDMAIKIDGDSMDNTYQGNIGDLGLVFAVEVDTGNPVVEVIKKVPVINKIPGIQTGDTTALTMIIAGVIASGALIIILIIKGRKEKDNGETK